jgi:hypothetical protein
MVKMIATTFAAIALLGCGAQSPQPILTPLEVKVPVATPVYCEVGKLAKPELPIAALKPDSAAADTVRAYAATVAILKGAVRQRDLLLQGCGAPASAPVPAAASAGAAASEASGEVR